MKSTHKARSVALAVFNDTTNSLSVRFAALKVVCEKGGNLNVSVAERCIHSFLSENFGAVKKEQKLREGALAILVKTMKQFELQQKKKKLEKRERAALKHFERSDVTA